MIEIIKDIAEKYSYKTAYIINSNKITYGELWNCACKKAQFLDKQGKGPVILYGHKSVDMVISILACLISKRAYVPVDIYMPIERINTIIRLLCATLFIDVDTILNERMKEIIEDCINLNRNIILDKDVNDIAYIIFTSGSTGKPKGVPISINNLNNFVKWISKFKPLSDYNNINVLNQASFSFDLSVADIFYSLCNGHTLIGLDRKVQENYDEIFNVVRDNSINLIVCTPTFIKLCIINKEFNSNNYPNLKCIYLCGEILEIKTVERLFEAFPNISIINAYGPTEATSAVSGIVITNDMLDNNILPVGRLSNFATDIYLENEEIILKGESVFKGYLGENSNMDCFRTGDIGYFKDDLLFCKGRKDNQIKYKGYRIDLMDIEKNLGIIKGVCKCAVIAKYNEAGVVKTIKAYVEKDNTCDIEDVSKYKEYIYNELSMKIPKYMLPKDIKILNTIPINSNGKIDRRRLRDL